MFQHRALRPLSAVVLVSALSLSACAAAPTTQAGASHDPQTATAEAGPTNTTAPSAPTEPSASATSTATPTTTPSSTEESTPTPSTDASTPTASTTATPTESTQATPPASSTAPAQPAGPVNCAKVNCVALTFDDGPGRYTQQVLDALTKHGAKATFFVIGTQIERFPELVKAEVADGMELGNHTWDHANLTRLTPAQQREELRRVDASLSSLVGVSTRFMRPPGGALTHSEKVALGKPIADWAVDTEDWRTRNTASTIKAASAAKPGEIVLMHDIHASTAAGVEQIVKNLQAKGYHLVTLTELIGKRPKLGIAYGWGQRP